MGEGSNTLVGFTLEQVPLRSIRKQAEQTMEKQANEQLPSMTSASTPSSRFLVCLSSCPDFAQWWTIIRDVKADTSHDVYHSNRKLIKSHLHMTLE